MKRHVIYGLIDPNTKELRYVGYTSNLKQRAYNHHNPHQLTSHTHKNNWLKSLLSSGQKSEMIILEEYESAQELPEAEIFAIAYFKSIGCNLTNGTDGGDGGSPMTGKRHSEETKTKISTSHKNVSSEYKNRRNKRLKECPIHLGHKHSDKTKTRMSESHKGKRTKFGAKINNVWLNKLRNLLNLSPLA